MPTKRKPIPPSPSATKLTAHNHLACCFFRMRIVADSAYDTVTPQEAVALIRADLARAERLLCEISGEFPAIGGEA